MVGKSIPTSPKCYGEIFVKFMVLLSIKDNVGQERHIMIVLAFPVSFSRLQFFILDLLV